MFIILSSLELIYFASTLLWNRYRAPWWNCEFWREWVKFDRFYFFSAQTFTTVGYGHISPTVFWLVHSLLAEALIRFIKFRNTAGLFFGRFSRPIAFFEIFA
jgi:hypothetical protein